MTAIGMLSVRGCPCGRFSCLAMLKRRLGCDFDRLHEHANTHLVLRQLLGHGEYDPVEYSYDTVLRDISLLDEDTLRAIRDLAGRSGIRLFRG